MRTSRACAHALMRAHTNAQIYSHARAHTAPTLLSRCRTPRCTVSRRAISHYALQLHLATAPPLRPRRGPLHRRPPCRRPPCCRRLPSFPPQHHLGTTITLAGATVGRGRGRAKRTCSRAERGVQQNFGAGDVAGCKFSGTGTYRAQQVAMPTPGNSTTLRRLQGCLDDADDRKLANSKISILIRRTNKSLKIGTPPWHSPSQKNTIGAI